MRRRKDIEADDITIDQAKLTDAAKVTISMSLSLEVLLDIRDLLAAQAFERIPESAREIATAAASKKP